MKVSIIDCESKCFEDYIEGICIINGERYKFELGKGKNALDLRENLYFYYLEIENPEHISLIPVGQFTERHIYEIL